MTHIHTLYLALLLSLLVPALFSCSNPQPQATELLVRAEELMEDHPDSALVVIDSIFYPEKSLKKEQYMRYNVARVRARYKNYLPVAEDTLIFVARDYFTSQAKNPTQTALAHFYSGCVYREQGHFEKTMHHFKEAETYANMTNDSNLKGLIQYNLGDMLSGDGLYKNALQYYKKAEYLYAQSSGNAGAKHAHSLGAMGRIYMLFGQQDSAFITLSKAVEIANSINDERLLGILTQNLSIAYMLEKDYQKATSFLHQSTIINNSKTNGVRYYLNLASIYVKTGQTDSVDYYTNQLEQMTDSTDNLSLKSSVFQFLAIQNKRKGNHDKAFDFQQRHSAIVEMIGNRRVEESVYEVQQRYDYVKQQNRYDQQLLQKQHLAIILLIFFLIASLFSVFLLRRVVKQKNRLISLQNAIDTLYETAKDLQKHKPSEGDKQQLREALLWKFNVLHKSSLLESQLVKMEKTDSKKTIAKFNQIVYGKDNNSQWNALIETMNELNPGLPQFIKNSYPQLSETQYKVCLLSYAGLPSKEIALLINQSVHTVNMARTAIRQKMGLQEPGADFCTVLREAYEKSSHSGIPES